MEYLSDKEIGYIIKRARMLRNLTQAELGERLGVQAAAVQKWESGKVEHQAKHPQGYGRRTKSESCVADRPASSDGFPQAAIENRAHWNGELLEGVSNQAPQRR